MRVVLEVLTGPIAGKKLRLGARQRARVGRTEWADLSVAQDLQMSGVHFQLETDNDTCYVCDLQSSNGTFVNESKIEGRTPVHNADRIRAGETVFAVHTEDVRSGFGTDTVVVAPASALRKRTSVIAVEGNVSYRAQQCRSGVTLCSAAVDRISPQQLALALSQIWPAYVCIDFNNLGTACPAEIQSPDYLFDWFTPDLAAQASPTVIGQDEYPRWAELVEAAWGTDTLVCFFSHVGKAPLLAHLRQVLRAKPGRGAVPAGILGICWPSVMGMLLTHGIEKQTQQILTGMEAVLVEQAEDSGTWQLFGKSSIATALDRLGLVCRMETDEKAAAAPSQPSST